MTTKELMLGDYVTFSDVQNDSDCPKLKVVIIEKEDVYVSIDGDPVVDVLDPKDLAGIPLTPEILEKNFSSTPEWYFEGTTKYCLRIGAYKNAWCFYYERGEKVLNLQVKIDFVHELQHALRICRIPKEIEL